MRRLSTLKSLIELKASAENDILSRALEVFGDRMRADEWMHEPNPALKNEVPVRCIQTEKGRHEVLNILGRIEHGVIS